MANSRFIFVCLLAGLAFVSGELVSSWANSGPDQLTGFEYDWGRYVFGGFGLYFVFAIYSLLYSPPFFEIADTQTTPSTQKVKESKANAFAAWTFLILMYFFIVLPLYSFAIYPFLPSQVGGGAPIFINLVTEDPQTNNYLEEQTSVMLLDRTEDEILVVVIDTRGQQIIYGFPRERVLYINYLP